MYTEIRGPQPCSARDGCESAVSEVSRFVCVFHRYYVRCTMPRLYGRLFSVQRSVGHALT